MPLAQDDTLLEALAAAVTAHAGVRATPVSRPLFGVALALPEGADPPPVWRPFLPPLPIRSTRPARGASTAVIVPVALGALAVGLRW